MVGHYLIFSVAKLPCAYPLTDTGSGRITIPPFIVGIGPRPTTHIPLGECHRTVLSFACPVQRGVSRPRLLRTISPPWNVTMEGTGKAEDGAVAIPERNVG